MLNVEITCAGRKKKKKKKKEHTFSRTKSKISLVCMGGFPLFFPNYEQYHMFEHDIKLN